jgi:hypothetical protein
MEPDGADHLSDVSVGFAASRTFACARADMCAESFEKEARRAGAWAIPVVDGRSRFLGFVSLATLSDGLADMGLPPKLARRVPIAHLVFGAHQVIWEGAPLYEGIRALARRRARILAVLGAGRSLSAVLTDIDAVRAASS